MNLSDYSIGFLGCGKISSALCHGFASIEEGKRPKKLLVSRRSEDKSSALARSYPGLVVVCDNNEDIVQECDVVFIGLLPQVARTELLKLQFGDKKLVISMMAAVGYDETKQLVSIDEKRLVRTVPLPSAARRSGPILIYPPNADAEQLLCAIGTPVVCITEAQMKPMIAVTGHISSFFELLRTSEEFLTKQGINKKSIIIILLKYVGYICQLWFSGFVLQILSPHLLGNSSPHSILAWLWELSSLMKA
ncbi:hypothetical protein EON65_10065 [archaeon]|nr:MAG: hypothetical protein EON65_10065 [archaeon]